MPPSVLSTRLFAGRFTTAFMPRASSCSFLHHFIQGQDRCAAHAQHLSAKGNCATRNECRQRQMTDACPDTQLSLFVRLSEGMDVEPETKQQPATDLQVRPVAIPNQADAVHARGTPAHGSHGGKFFPGSSDPPWLGQLARKHHAFVDAARSADVGRRRRRICGDCRRAAEAKPQRQQIATSNTASNQRHIFMAELRACPAALRSRAQGSTAGPGNSGSAHWHRWSCRVPAPACGTAWPLSCRACRKP